jgi:hypothetical protein
MGMFDKEPAEKTVEKQQDELLEQIEKEMLGDIRPLPKTAPWCALFCGENSTGKTGTALDFVQWAKLKKGETIFYMDAEEGAVEDIVQYHRKEYEKGFIRYPEVKVWKEDDKRGAVIDMDETLRKIKKYGYWLKKDDKYKELGIRLIVLDGLSKIKEWAEYQMKNEKNIDITGDVKYKYWRERNQNVLQIIELFKSIPVHTIFIGREDFNKAGKDMVAIDRDVNDIMSQKIFFRRETTDRDVTFFAKSEKTRQSFMKQGKEIQFAEVDLEQETYKWHGINVFDLLEPDKNEPL